MSEFEPIRMMEIELAEPLRDVPAVDPRNGRRHRRAHALVRLGGRPLGIAEIALGEEGSSAAAVSHLIGEQLLQTINHQLVAGGQAPIQAVSPEGLPVQGGSFGISPPLENAPSMSVIIPSRDRPERLRVCVDSLLQSDYPSDRLEILVVDNAPATRGTHELIHGVYADVDLVRYVREDIPGSASARNQGLVMAGGELVAFTDDDVVVDRHWLSELGRAFVDYPQVSCVSGLLLPWELETQAQVWFEEYGGFSRGFERRLYDLKDHRLDDPLYPYSAGVFGTGNNMGFRAEAIRSIGGFDPALGNGTPALGGVDSEALLRTVLEGRTVLYEPAAIVHHIHRADYTDLRKQVYSYGVGLTAYLLKTMLSRPELIPDVARRIPAGLRFALSPTSEKNDEKRGDYPSELTRLELRGMAYGPLAYLRSRRDFGRHRRALTVPAGTESHALDMSAAQV